MARLVFMVASVFDIRGRGVVVCPSDPVTRKDFPDCREGSPIELRRPGLTAIRTMVAGTPVFKPNIDILLRDLKKADIPVGTEVWLLDTDEAQALERGGLE
ncbi:MAG: hypothetical protein ACYSU0_18460 [Planctomycetota bacterium]